MVVGGKLRDSMMVEPDAYSEEGNVNECLQLYTANTILDDPRLVDN